MMSPVSPAFSQPTRPNAQAVQFAGKTSQRVRNALGTLGVLAIVSGGALGSVNYVQADKAYDGKVDFITLNPNNFDEAETKAIEDASDPFFYLAGGGALMAIGSRMGRRKNDADS